MTTITATITAICSVVATLATTWVKLRGALAPLLRRRRFPVAIVAAAEHDANARAFAEKLRGTGFRDVAMTRDASTCLGRRAVVLWQPEPEGAAGAVERVRDVALEAVVLVYTTQRLQVALGEHVLLANSTLRLRGDLGVLAEAG